MCWRQRCVRSDRAGERLGANARAMNVLLLKDTSTVKETMVIGRPAHMAATDHQPERLSATYDTCVGRKHRASTLD